jgi:hypothetical protein
MDTNNTPTTSQISGSNNIASSQEDYREYKLSSSDSIEGKGRLWMLLLGLLFLLYFVIGVKLYFVVCCLLCVLLLERMLSRGKVKEGTLSVD